MENVEGIIHLDKLRPFAKISEDVVLFINRDEIVSSNTLAVQVNFYMRKIDPVQTIFQYKKTQGYTLIESHQLDEYYYFLLRKKFSSRELAKMLMNFSEVKHERVMSSNYSK